MRRFLVLCGFSFLLLDLNILPINMKRALYKLCWILSPENVHPFCHLEFAISFYWDLVLHEIYSGTRTAAEFWGSVVRPSAKCSCKALGGISSHPQGLCHLQWSDLKKNYKMVTQVLHSSAHGGPVTVMGEQGCNRTMLLQVLNKVENILYQ